MWIVDPFHTNTFNQAAINMSHNLKFMFQTPPFYGLVLLLPQLRVYGALAWGPDELYITRHAPLNKTLWLWELTARAHRKTVLVSCPQCKDQYEKALEDVSAYTPRYMEEMESIFEQSQEEERKRISFLKQAFLSIHRHLDVTNNERWAACVPIGCILRLTVAAFIRSVWKPCTMSSTKPWCPSMSKMIWNGGRTTMAPACPPTGQRLRFVKNTFPAHKRSNLKTTNARFQLWPCRWPHPEGWCAYFMLIDQDWVPPVKKLNRKKRQKRKESRPWVVDRGNLSEWADSVRFLMPYFNPSS